MKDAFLLCCAVVCAALAVPVKADAADPIDFSSEMDPGPASPLTMKQCLSVITVDPRPFKVRPIGKDLAPLADCHASGLADFS